MDRKFVMTGFGYAVLGLLLGIYMAASHNHQQLVTHAHIMLIGFVVSFSYAVCHRLWLNNLSSGLAQLQFWLHQAGALILLSGLFLLYGKFIDPQLVDAVLALASVVVFSALVLMKVLLIRHGRFD